MLLLVGTPFVLGGSRHFTDVPIWGFGAVLALLLLAGPDEWKARARSAPLLWPGLAFCSLILLQLVPLPGSPFATLSPARSARGLAFVATAWVVHLASFALLGEPRARDRMRAVLSHAGLALAFVALAQSALDAWSVYGLIPLEQPGAPFGPFWNRNHYAGYMVMLVPLALGRFAAALEAWLPLAHEARGWRSRAATLLDPRGSAALEAFVPPAAALVSLVASLSRGGMLSLLAGLGVARVASPSRAPVWIVRMALALTAASVLLVGVDRLGGRFASVRDEFLPGSRGRVSTWRASLQAVPGAWLTGWGFNTFPLAVSDWVMYPAAHNQYLQLLVETGITGLGLALWAAWNALRAVRRDAWLLAAVSGALLHAFVEFGLEVPALGLLLACLAAWPAPGNAPGDRPRPV